MFEVDWADPDCERVGQRQARKEQERELKKVDSRSSHGASISTRTSNSSDRHRLGFFGSIGRNRNRISTASSKSKGKEPEQESKPPTLNPELRIVDGKSKRNSHRISRATATSASKVPDNVSVVPEEERANCLPALVSKSTTEGTDFSCPETPDRSSKESMLSKMTELTIPTVASPQIPISVPEAVPTSTKVVQAQDEEGCFSARPQTAPSPQWKDELAGFARVNAEAKIAANPKTPRTPKIPPSFHSPSPHGNDKSASQLIDEWYTALHNSTQRLAVPGADGIFRSGNVLLPPNLYQPFPATPTRRSTKTPTLVPANPSKIKFLANDPNDWKTPDEWDFAGSDPDEDATPVRSDEAGAQESEDLSWIAADLRDIHDQEEPDQETDGLPQDDHHPLNLTAEKVQGLNLLPSVLEEEETMRSHNQSTTAEI